MRLPSPSFHAPSSDLDCSRNNSAQCLRIRALDSEVSSLKSENLRLREEIVHLQAQLSEPRATIDNSALVSVKDQLQAKLLEFGALVSELGHIQSNHPSNQHVKLSDPSSWRPEVPAAILSGQAPRMHGIDEETASPGGSLEYVEAPPMKMRSDADKPRHARNRALRLSDHSQASPDLGSPPQAHFENDDPITFDPLPAETYQTEQSTSDNESLPENLSINLETRKKRRDGSSKGQLRRSSLLQPDLDDQEQPQLTRTSAKRKLSVRDVENEGEQHLVKDDFKFSRRSSIAADFRANEPALEDTETPVLFPERKVLGNKSVNVSPRKLSRPTKGKGEAKKEEAPLKPAVKTADRRKSRNPTAKSVSIATTEPETIVQTTEVAYPSEALLEDLAPKTPLPEFLSPTPSEPSTARDQGRDTPPPSGLKSMSSGPAALNGASRPSRRARAAVNYAEPNLVSKMRRPAASLANAVDASGRRISTSNNMLMSDQKTTRTVMIKDNDDISGSLARELDSETAAASPLGQKADREHDRLLDTTTTMTTTKTTSASGRAISALMAGAKKYERQSSIEELGVYELKDSSDTEERLESNKRISGRRHSLLTESGGSYKAQGSSNYTEEEQDEAGGEDVEVQAKGKRAPRSARVDRSGARRRSMMV
jgi:hypothetical protein